MPPARPDSTLDVSRRFARALAKPGALWVTDADGTLWSGDLGETFLRELVADDALVAEGAKFDAWNTYQKKVARDRPTGYAWAVQAMAGLTVADVRRRAEKCARSFVSSHLFPAMRALIDEANACGAEVWIVTASAELVVQAAAPLVGLDPSRVVGVRVEEMDGRLTDLVAPPITWGAGKVEAIRQRIGRAPSVVSGDSAGDLDMLALATDAALLVRSEHSDQAIVARAKAAGWLVESFTTAEVHGGAQ